LHRQLPGFGRLAYPVRAEVTKRVLPGRKSLGCPVEKSAAVETTWEVSKLGGLNIKKCLQSRKPPPRDVVFVESSGRPTHIYAWGRPLTLRKKQVSALSGTAVTGDETSEERFAEITSGRARWQQGLVATCKDFQSRRKPKKGRAAGFDA
jgi:hypothetical protein